jgi:hypothetical protein
MQKLYLIPMYLVFDIYKFLKGQLVKGWLAIKIRNE